MSVVYAIVSLIIGYVLRHKDVFGVHSTPSPVVAALLEIAADGAHKVKQEIKSKLQGNPPAPPAA